LNAALTNLAAGEVRYFDLASDNQEFPALKVGSSHCGDDIRHAGTSGYKSKGTAIRRYLIEVFRGNPRRNFVDDGDARKLVAAAFKQMHDVAASDEKAMSIAEFGKPGGELVTIFHALSVPFAVVDFPAW
jgi:hypothetical protein